jgi:hypothetical protein
MTELRSTRPAIEIAAVTSAASEVAHITWNITVQA